MDIKGYYKITDKLNSKKSNEKTKKIGLGRWKMGGEKGPM